LLLKLLHFHQQIQIQCVPSSISTCVVVLFMVMGDCSCRVVCRCYVHVEFRVKLTENSILKYHITDARLSGRPQKNTPPTRIRIPRYPSCTVTSASNENPCRRCVVCNNLGQRRKTRYNCEGCKVAQCGAPFATLPYGGWLTN
jgi:hypothetical protein